MKTKKEVAILIYDWQYRNGDSFTCKLFELIIKADYENKLILEKAYPIEYEVFYEWYHNQDQINFFSKYGMGSDIIKNHIENEKKIDETNEKFKNDILDITDNVH